MRFHAFDMSEPVPELNAPHAMAIIKPWIDVSNVGSLILSCLETYLGSKELARLTRPGNFFDLTRYRPTLVRKENSSEVDIPNAVINYSKQSEGQDFLLLRLLEPHMMAETYVDSVVELLKTFGVRRYCFIGSMYDMVPYTRPLLVTGSASNLALQNELAIANVIPSYYEGPTTILSLIGQKALQLGIETCSMIVHLPGYLTMEYDYRGMKRLIEVISPLYDFPMPQVDMEKANQQEEQVRQAAEQIMQQEPSYKVILQQLEANYDSRIKKEKAETQLSPEVEKFLQDVSRRFTQG
jgi:predicted ATP-grasp superfamily ATP-dependent carboligase